MNSKTEAQWRAENDAHTMAEYQRIISDRARMNRAIKVAKSQAADLTKRANAMKSVANTKACGGSISRKKK